MKLTYTNTAGKLTLEAEVANSVEAFETMAEFTEVFDETCCGACASTNIRFDVRRPQTYVYYNLVCRDCGCRLDVSQHKNTKTLFISRKDDAGNPLPHDGWYKYQPEGERNQESGARGQELGKTKTAPPDSAPKTAPVGDLYGAAIAAAKTKAELKAVGDRIFADSTIPGARLGVLRAAYDVRQKALNGKGK
jgi:hypothetical protein